MSKTQPRLTGLLDRVEREYGVQKSAEPRDALGLLLFRNSGYPQSDANCTNGFAALKAEIGLQPDEILGAPVATLRKAMRAGGIVPELRAQRLREIATRVRDEYGNNLTEALRLPLLDARKVLASFPTISEAGADKILLFTRNVPVAALPSNCLQVPLRLGYGRDTGSWSVGYRTAREAIASELPETFEDRIRAYLLLKRLGHEVCKRSNPRCDRCPVARSCPYFNKLKSARTR